ncbi:hypothetical protein FGG08_005636 [Glutinoglossum americanum]|uniref:AAA+ ATPase domain-containing protein n=1 Tax=Glutinoglossum americanum TaxID=1670608 RepID=A0A9P8L182_9PEZI|nr:hypothetical protein FGG08_005636 [Glutinoglossum americanum]
MPAQIPPPFSQASVLHRTHKVQTKRYLRMSPEILNSEVVSVCVNATTFTDSAHALDSPKTMSPTISLIGKTGEVPAERRDSNTKPREDESVDGIPSEPSVKDVPSNHGLESQTDIPSRGNSAEVEEYVKRMEDRMFFLEEKFRVLHKEVFPQPAPEQVVEEISVEERSPTPPQETVIEPRINRLSVPRRVNLRRHNIPPLSLKLFAMDVHWRFSGPHHKTRLGSHAGNEHWSAASVGGTETSSPDRVRINSPVITKFLSEVIGETLAEVTTFLHPFKVLVCYEEKIRQRVHEITRDVENLRLLQSVTKLEEDPLSPQTPTTKLKDQNGKNLSNGDGAEADKASESGEAGEDDEDEETVDKEDEEDVDEEDEEDEKPAIGENDLAYLQCLIEFMDVDMKSIWELRGKIRDRSLLTIAFTDLWHLFPQGEVITGGRKQLYRVLHVTGARRYRSDTYSFLFAPDLADGHLYDGEVTVHMQPSYPVTCDQITPFFIDCFYLDFDGKNAGQMRKRFQIMSFEGQRPITDLYLYPVGYAEGEMDRLWKRGKRFASMARVGHQQYTGLSLDEPREEVKSDLHATVFFQVIVDPTLAFLNQPHWQPTVGSGYGLCDSDSREIVDNICLVRNCNSHPDYSIYDDTRFERSRSNENIDLVVRSKPIENLTKDELILLCSRVFGFVLRSRKWCTLELELMQDVEMRDDGFNSLVLPAGHKDLVRALVVAHARGTRSTTGDAEEEHQVDLVRGKGKGLIILLHGVPGVGKTSTAECVADLTKRPLFPVTCGDIGETASEVEENLEKNFQLAHKWGCVLLLDEADVFLQKRDKSDMKRNSLVSGQPTPLIDIPIIEKPTSSPHPVFLRVLEYYSGILFLTTNRVGTFDEAFKSRIHISLYYPALNKKSTLKVWKMNLERTKRGKLNLKVNDQEIIEFAKHHYASSSKSGRWNGRQIRNAFQTAIALAEFEAKSEGGETKRVPYLTKAHFKKVAEASAEFNHYLVQVYRGDDDSRRAELDQVRQDDYKTPKFMPKPSRATGSSSKQHTRRPQSPETEPEESESSSSFSDEDVKSEDYEIGKKGKASKGWKGKDGEKAGKGGGKGKKAKKEESSEESSSEVAGEARRGGRRRK